VNSPYSAGSSRELHAKIYLHGSCLLLLFLAPVRAQQQQGAGTYLTHIGDRLFLTESYRATALPNGSLKLDHLFYEGEGAASGADYERPRNIPRYVIAGIAAWIKKQ
jgi:hypothetical protein